MNEPKYFSDLSDGDQRAALVSLIDWCLGQMLTNERTTGDAHYNRGVMACVRIMEDALPPPEQQSPAITSASSDTCTPENSGWVECQHHNIVSTKFGMHCSTCGALVSPPHPKVPLMSNAEKRWRATLNRLVRDAARYRFLRPHLFLGDGGGVQIVHNTFTLGNEFTGHHRVGADLDRALDAAMKQCLRGSTSE